MNKVVIICSIIGILLILSSFINFKSNRKKKTNYTVSGIKKIFVKLKNSKIISLVINEDSKSNKKLLQELRLISECKIASKKYKFSFVKKNSDNKNDGVSKYAIDDYKELEQLKNVYISKIIIIILVLALGFVVKLGFKGLVVEQKIHPNTIHESSMYRISGEAAQSTSKYIGQSYKSYFKKGDFDGFRTKLTTYITNTDLDIDEQGIETIINAYQGAYEEGKLNLIDIASIVAASLLASFLIRLIVSIRFKICNFRLVTEFYEIELMALTHMNRIDINVREILTEINNYTVYLRPYLNRCLNRYANDPIMALDKLTKEVDNPKFTDFIFVLKSCLDNSKEVNLKVLQIQRELRLLSEKTDNDKSIEFKNLYRTIAQFPLIAVFCANLILPFLTTISFNSSFAF